MPLSLVPAEESAGPLQQPWLEKEREYLFRLVVNQKEMKPVPSSPLPKKFAPQVLKPLP